MKKTCIAVLASALLGFGSLAVADEPTEGPVTMTDIQMELVVAGSNRASVDDSRFKGTRHGAVICSHGDGAGLANGASRSASSSC